MLSFDFQALPVFSHSWLSGWNPPLTSPLATHAFWNPRRIRRTHFDILTIIFCVSLLHLSKRIRIACSIFNNTLCAFWLLLLFVLFSLVRTRTAPIQTHSVTNALVKCACKTVFVVMSTPHYTPTVGIIILTRHLNKTYCIFLITFIGLI